MADDRPSRDTAWLAIIPVGVAVVLGLLMLPRRPPPEGIPLPLADAHMLSEVVSTDHTLAETARRQPLPGPVRALGSAVREFHTLEAHDADARALGDARRAVDASLIEALGGGVEPLRLLRAAQLEAFLDEVRRFQATGEESPELQALAGGFVRSMRAEGYVEGHVLAPPPPVLRAMFKQMWNAFLGLDARDPRFAPAGAGDALKPTLDEQRALYAFYLSHPHPSRPMRDAIAAARRAARDATACQAIVEAERAACEAWLLERIARLSAIDPFYPADYARGVASYRRGDFRASVDAFRRWVGGHPEGPLALRARNFLRAAAAEADQTP